MRRKLIKDFADQTKALLMKDFDEEEVSHCNGAFAERNIIMEKDLMNFELMESLLMKP